VVSSYSPSIVDIIQIAALRQGITILASLVAGAFVAYVVYRYVRTRRLPNFQDAFLLTMFVAFGAVSTVFFFFDVIGGFGRSLLYARFAALVVSGSFLYTLHSRLSKRHSTTGIMTLISVLFVALILVSMFSVFHSPLERRHNHQMTEMELQGGEWQYTFQDGDQPIDELGIYQYRLHDMLYGLEESSTNVRRRRAGTQPPDHFGYDTGSVLGDRYQDGSRTYLLVTRLGRRAYPDVFPDYPQYWRFTPDDFVALEYDPTVAHLYDNGEFDSYSIRGTNESVQTNQPVGS